MKHNSPSEKITLEIKERGGRRRLLEFASEEDRRGWEKAYRKSKLYTPYFLCGVGVNFILYFMGLDLTGNLFLGALVGLAIPLASMFLLAELHYRLLIENKSDNPPGKG